MGLTSPFRKSSIGNVIAILNGSPSQPFAATGFDAIQVNADTGPDTVTGLSCGPATH